MKCENCGKVAGAHAPTCWLVLSIFKAQRAARKGK